MWNFTTSLLEKFAGLSPLKSFLKFIFQRFSKDYLDKEPNIDFRNGILDLEDLPLSATKINKSLLLSSPYCMHSGSIKQLRIVIPNLTELSTKSIEVYITGVHISLRPNKQFEKNFQQKLTELKQCIGSYREDQKFFPEQSQQKPLQADSDNSIDFFKQLLKQILTNIKVRISNVCVQLFMNSPSEGSVANPQYYSMLRVPSLLFERFTDREIGKEGEEFQKYRLEVPQISTHLLRQDMKIPEYGNLIYSERDFPWQYPTANHPSTIMLVGSEDIKNPVNCISLVLRISTDAKRKSKDILVKLDVPNVEVMMEGYQLQILLKYLDQLKEFKQAWKSVMDKQKLHEKLQQQQIGIEQSKDFEVPNMTHVKKNSRNSTGGIDIFASVVIAFEDDGTEKRQSQKRKTDFIDSIFLENDSEAQNLKKEMLHFNREVSAEFKGNMVQDKTEYKSTFTVDVGVQLVRLYLLKYNTFTATEYQRCWAKQVNKRFLWLNENMPCSYFQFSLKSLALQRLDSEHITLSVRKADLKNIKLFTLEDEAIFHDPINQSTASFDARGLSDSPKQKQERLGRSLIKFVIKQGDHYCSSTLLSVSPRGSAKVYKDGRNKRYNLLADATLGEKLPSCLTVKLQKNKKQLKVQVEVGRIGLLVDLEAGRDLINIVYPMFMYRHLVESINLKWQDPSQNTKKNNPMSIYFSNYGTASGRDAEHNGGDKSSSHQKKSLSLDVKSIRVAMLDNNPRLFENLAERERRKTQDWQSFERDCFCGCSGTTVGLEIREITCNIQKKSVVARVGELELGSFQLTTTKPALFTPFVVLASPNRPVELFHEKIQDGGIKIKRFVGLYIPKCELSVPGREHPARLADMVHQHAKACLLLKNYFSDLRQQMSLLQTGKPPQPKEKGLNAIPVFFMLDIENINVYYASFGILVKHVIVEFETTKLITVKINDALIIELENRRVVLKSSDSAKLTQQSYDPQGYSIERFSSTTTKISSDRIIVWLDGCTAFNSPNFQARDRSYYAWLQKQYYCIEITVKKNIAERPQLTKACQIKQTQTFSFAKPKKEEKPKEQQQNLCTDIKIKTPLCVRSCELKELPKLLNDILFLKTHTDRIQKDLKSLNPSARGDKPRNKEMTVTVRADRLLVDSFPYYEKQVNCSILANSRSALNIQQFYFEMVKIEKVPQINQSKQHMRFHCQMKEINGGFLVFKDSYPESNPITMPVDHFKDYGFRDIAVLKCVVFDMRIEEFQAKRKEIDLSVVLDHVEYSSSASTTLHLQNHIADVLKCMPKPPPKRQANPPRPVIEINSDCQDNSQQDEAVDLNEIDLKHERQKQQRADEQNQLRQRNIEIVVRPNYFTNINVRQVAIKSLIITIFSGEDFSFLPTNPTEIKYREKDVAIHLNQDNSVMTVMQLENPKQFVETRVRFRGGEVNWHKFIKAELVGLEFRMLKQNQKTAQQPSQHLQCKMRIGSAFCYLSQMQADRFVILKLSEELLIGVEKEHSKIRVKTSAFPKIQMGFNSTLNFISKERKQAKQLISQSSFARKQVNKEGLPKPAEVVNDLLLFIPEFALVLDVKLVGISVFKQLEVKVGELLFHNQLSQYLEEDNKAFIKSWVRQILKGNIGSLLGNSFIHILQQGMWLLLAAIKQLFGLPGELFRALTR